MLFLARIKRVARTRERAHFAYGTEQARRITEKRPSTGALGAHPHPAQVIATGTTVRTTVSTGFE